MAAVSPLPKVAFVLQVKITLDPKDTEIFLSHFKPVYDRVLAEPECAYFIIGQNIQAPGEFSWTEGWTKDAQWFMTEQITKDYYKPYLEATEPLFKSPRVAEAYAPLEGFNHVKIDL